MAPFYGRGLTVLRLQSHYEETVYFLISSPGVSSTHLINLRRMKYWVDLAATQRFWTRDPWIGNPIPYHKVNAAFIWHRISLILNKIFQGLRISIILIWQFIFNFLCQVSGVRCVFIIICLIILTIRFKFYLSPPGWVRRQK